MEITTLDLMVYGFPTRARTWDLRIISAEFASWVFPEVGNIDMAEIDFGEGQWFAIRGGLRFFVR
jgi:hypothetical protein